MHAYDPPVAVLFITDRRKPVQWKSFYTLSQAQAFVLEQHDPHRWWIVLDMHELRQSYPRQAQEAVFNN